MINNGKLKDGQNFKYQFSAHTRILKRTEVYSGKGLVLIQGIEHNIKREAHVKLKRTLL